MRQRGRLGEREIIEIIQGKLDLMPGMPVPFGDDVSACSLGNGRLAVLKTDMLVGRTDVPSGMSLWQAARKAVVMNVSDFAAKGVKPLAMLVSLGLPNGLGKEEIEQIGKGLNAGAREYGSYIIGGDTGEATDLTISLSVFGVAEKGEMPLRGGARHGDVVAVTGFFGKTSAGLKILVNSLEAPQGIREALVSSVLMPHARLSEGLALNGTRAVTAAIDSSDGLAWSLHQIAMASNVGMILDRLPVAPEAKALAKTGKLNSTELALYGGEEYELVLTIKPRLWSKAENAAEKAGGKLSRIGKVTRTHNIVLQIGGKRIVVEPRGYEHFVHNA